MKNSLPGDGENDDESYDTFRNMAVGPSVGLFPNFLFFLACSRRYCYWWLLLLWLRPSGGGGTADFSVCTRPALVGSERQGKMKEKNVLLQRGYVMRGQISSLIALEQQGYPQPQSRQKTKYNKQVREFLCVDCGWPAGDLSSHVWWRCTWSSASVLFDSFARRSDGWDLLCGQGTKGLSYEMRMRLNHRFPSGRFHHICSMSESNAPPMSPTSSQWTRKSDIRVDEINGLRFELVGRVQIG